VNSSSLKEIRGRKRRRALQSDAVLDHLRSGKSINSDEAWDLYKVRGLPAVISKIEKEEGLNIQRLKGEASQKDRTTYFLEQAQEVPEIGDETELAINLEESAAKKDLLTHDAQVAAGTNAGRIRRHLEANKWISADIASDQYGIGLSSLYSAVNILREAGFDILTEQYRDKHGDKRPIYNLIALPASASDSPEPEPEPEPETEQVESTAGIVSIRLDEDGSELQVMLGEKGPEIRLDRQPICKLTPIQAHCLSANLKLFADMATGR
jgi:hypothetical protein